MDSFVVQNQPNAGKLISSLRNTGYDSYSAIEDIIDNSIDAQARDIIIRIETIQSDLRIMIADNGRWMTRDILDQALRLGSISDKTEASDLWKFGMWLCTASISMSKRLEVITRASWADCFYSCQDLDDITKENQFIKLLRNANTAETSVFSDIIGDPDSSGTLIVLTKIDRLSDKNTSQFATTLSKSIWRKFRNFIDSWITISINWKRIASIDPIMLANEETSLYSDETYELPFATIGWIKESIRVKIALLPEFTPEKMKEMKIGIKWQGFYVMRNNREIANAVTLGVFQRHNDFNRLRMELFFNATLDDEFGVRFSKDWIKPSQEIIDFLKQEIGGQIMSIRKIIKKAQNVDQSSQVDHSESEDVIAQKSKSLITPDAKIEKRRSSSRGGSSDTVKPDAEQAHERKNFREVKTSPHGMWARFESASMGREWMLYECEQEWKITVIRWNIDHPFYERMVLENKENKNITSWIDYLIFSLASAELKSINDDNIELLMNIKTIMSSNLRSLLS